MPGNTDRFLEDHEEYDGLSVEIEQLAARIRNANGAERVELGVEVHERFNVRADAGMTVVILSPSAEGSRIWGGPFFRLAGPSLRAG